MRSVLRQAGIKPSRAVRDLMAQKRRCYRRALIRLAGHHTRRDWTLWVDWESALFYDASIPRSLRTQLEKWRLIRDTVFRANVAQAIVQIPTSPPGGALK